MKKIIITILILLSFLGLFPLMYMFYLSFVSDPTGIAGTFTLNNYSELFSQSKIMLWIMNTMFVCCIVTFIQIHFNGMAAFALNSNKIKYSGIILKLLIILMAVPGQLIVIFLFLEMVHFNLLDSLMAVIIPGLAAPFGIFYFYQSLSSIPKDYYDALEIDGATPFQQYRHMVVPLMKPAILTLAIFIFVAYWNSFFWPLLVLNSPDKYTLSVGLSTLKDQHTLDYGIVMAASVITAIPTILLFLLFERYFEKGVVWSGFK